MAAVVNGWTDVVWSYRVAWNTQGFLWTWKTRGILREFCATSEKNCNYLVRVPWWPVILLELMWNDPWWRSLLHLLCVVITYGKVSLWVWNSLENSGNFFLLTCGHPVIVIVWLMTIITYYDLELAQNITVWTAVNCCGMWCRQMFTCLTCWCLLHIG